MFQYLKRGSYLGTLFSPLCGRSRLPPCSKIVNNVLQGSCAPSCLLYLSFHIYTPVLKVKLFTLLVFRGLSTLARYYDFFSDLVQYFTWSR